jgi:23S rRNA pseudouridine2605 synthase
LAKRLSHPSHFNKKIYQVTLDKPITKKDFEQIAEGVELEDGQIAADEISYIDPEDKTELGIEIHSGKNRVVRRMFEHLGYNVKKLDRVYYAGLTKKKLPRGKWRFLSPQEVSFLKMK